MEKWKFQSAYDGDQPTTPGMWVVSIFAIGITCFWVGYWVGTYAPW